MSMKAVDREGAGEELMIFIKSLSVSLSLSLSFSVFQALLPTVSGLSYPIICYVIWCSFLQLKNLAISGRRSW
jgi:hypothetical protein